MKSAISQTKSLFRRANDAFTKKHMLRLIDRQVSKYEKLADKKQAQFKSMMLLINMYNLMFDDNIKINFKHDD